MKNEIKDFKVGDDVKWSGDYFNGYKDGKDITDLRLTVTGDIKLEDVVLLKHFSGVNKIVSIEPHKFLKNEIVIILDNDKMFFSPNFEGLEAIVLETK